MIDAMKNLGPGGYQPPPPLKPCPLCGGRAEAYDCALIFQNWIVKCMTCGLHSEIGKFNKESDAIAYWNRRINETGN